MKVTHFALIFYACEFEIIHNSVYDSWYLNPTGL